MHGSRFRFQVPVPVSLYRCIAVSLFSSSPNFQGNALYFCVKLNKNAFMFKDKD